MKKEKYIYYSLFLAIGSLFSCSEMDESMRKFIKNGEIITYAPKVNADSVETFAGRNRIKLSMASLNARITNVKISWNNNTKSVTVPVEEVSNNDFDVLLPDMDERSYSFEVVAYDHFGNSSVKVFASGNVYGDIYAGTLLSRAIKSTNLRNGTATIDWYGGKEEIVSTEVNYIDNKGVVREVLVAANETKTILTDFVSGNSINHRTLYLPEPTAIDTFYSAFKQSDEIVEVEALADKSKFQKLALPTDDWQAHTGNTSWNIERAWDGITDNDGVLFHATRTGFPSWVSIDLGTLTRLTRMKLWGRTTGGALFNKGNLKLFEVYGRADAPDPNNDTWDGWTKILDGVSQKPSGLPDYQTNSEDLAYALAGQDFYFDTAAAPARYIRINVLDSWGPDADNYWYINELSFWGFER